MKRAWVLVALIALTALIATGCSGNNNENGNNAGASSEAPASSEASSGGDVTIVFPAMLNESGDVEGMTAEVKEAGGTNVTENGDGSVSVTISSENLNNLLGKYHAELTTIIEELHSAAHSEDNSSSIKELEYDRDYFKEYTLTVDKAAYEASEGAEGLAIFALAMQSIMYQVYSGVDAADLKVTFNLVDQSNGETFETSVFPEA